MKELQKAFVKTIGSLFAPKMLGVLLLTVFVTMLSLAGFMAIVVASVSYISDWFFGILNHLPWVGFTASSFIALLLFPIMMPIIMSFFDVKIIEVIEEKDYPAIKPAIKRRAGSKLLRDMRFVLVLIVVNIMVIPFYLIPFLNFILFPVLNGYMFGREFFMINARRHLPIKDAKKLRSDNAWTITLGGILFMVIATIPFLNLFAPFWGIAMMTHLFHGYYKKNLAIDNKS